MGGTDWDLTKAEDMFALVWPPGSQAAAFREQGCALLCHDGHHRNPGGTDVADFWRWGAQTTASHPVTGKGSP